MNRTMKTFCIAISLSFLTTIGFAEQKKENQWEKDFVQALQKGKAKSMNKSGGLGYQGAESSVLEKAVKKAMEQKAPPCEAMKIAVNLQYQAYDVISNIFSQGAEVNLNQLCMCATESGINKQLVAKAAKDTVTPLGKPVFPRDEIAQAQCLNDVGLGYTQPTLPPPPIKPPVPPNPISVFTSGGGAETPPEEITEPEA
ncbi:MAG: hypothetical protein L3J69_15860 [Desulfobacula sp.]|nr:hypothetical protein [Desulfobacula sp.]